MDSGTEPLQLIADIKFVLWPNTLNASIKIIAKVFDHIPLSPLSTLLGLTCLARKILAAIAWAPFILYE